MSNFEPLFVQDNNANMTPEQNEVWKLKQELNRRDDPTYRDPFNIPEAPSGYVSHETDDQGVKDAAKAFIAASNYLAKQVTEYTIQEIAFEAAIADQRKTLADYEAAVTKAVEAGKDAPDYPDLRPDDLKAIHRTMDGLELVIQTAAGKTAEAASKLRSERARLYASPTYHKWAEKELSRLTEELAEAAKAARDAASEREAIIGNLPDAFADLNGVAFKEPVKLGNNIASSPYKDAASLDEALDVVWNAAIPGDGIRPWKADQLSPEAREDYETRAATAKVKRDAQ